LLFALFLSAVFASQYETILYQVSIHPHDSLDLTLELSRGPLVWYCCVSLIKALNFYLTQFKM